ncbi:36669_t:CDS:1 [Racocetra persica]|uniref:36669_t:CDS:1 n=1 Tax=Racocetra persica TaxID=160502 RepID=A0ACA9QBR8_9GLOM|nr:36669_t:CDS:1 [Racocetra persica]
MVNANEWLNNKIPADKRKPITHFNINSCTGCSSVGTTNINYYGILEGELDLNEFVSLKELYITGDGNQQQKLTSLKVDKCTKLTNITINFTTLGYLYFGSKPNLVSANFSRNKRLNFCDNDLKNQVGKLTTLILITDDLKLETKKIKEKSLEYHLDVIRNGLDKANQLWLESLQDTQEEVLRSNSAYARKQLERCKNGLSEVLTDEEIQDILGKIIEINELGTQLNNRNRLQNLSLNG